MLLLLAVGFTTARVLLPELAQRKDEIEAAINRVSPRAVRIEKLSTYWDGWHPGLQVQGLQVFAADRKTPALRLEELRISLAWWPLLRREFEIHSLEVSRPSLVLERLADGRFRLAGFDPVRPGTRDRARTFSTGCSARTGWRSLTASSSGATAASRARRCVCRR